MALTQVQLERELERIIGKQARGEKLTRKEWQILAYGPVRCPSTTVRVRW
jgi:hypothetical protein